MGAISRRPLDSPVAYSLIIPCCNEAAGLPQLERTLSPVIASLRDRGPIEVILIDDGSTDDTWGGLEDLTARLPEVRLLRHPMNYGLGAALRTGFAFARGNIVITTDADGTYPLREIPELLQRLTPGTDVVTASPYHPDGGVDGVPRWRLLFSRCASQCYRMVLGRNGKTIHTYTSLFRAYRREILPYIAPDNQGFLSVAEILVRASLAGYTIAEYPTVLRARQYGQSKARVASITMTHLNFLATILLHRVRVRRPIPSPVAPSMRILREADGD